MLCDITFVIPCICIVNHCNILQYIANAILLPLQKTCDIDYCASLVHGIGDLLNYCPTLISTTYQQKLVAIVVDEAHCVKTWGDQFRVVFSHIGDIRSLVPSHVNLMALTATATPDTLHSVVQRLSLKAPVVIAMSPYRNNISYKLVDKATIDELTSELCEELKSKGTTFPKTVVFVRSYRDCSCIYVMLKWKLVVLHRYDFLPIFR